MSAESFVSQSESEVRGQESLRHLSQFSFFVWFLFASDRLLRPKRTEPAVTFGQRVVEGLFP